MNPVKRPIRWQFLADLAPWLLFVATAILVLSQLPRPLAVLPLWRQWAEVGALACAMTAIMLTGGIDLSVGSMIALCGMVVGLLWRDWGWPIGMAALAGVATGFVAGACNGGLVLLGIAPLVATLATMGLYAGLAMALAGGQRIAGLPESFTWLGQGSTFGLPNQLYLLATVALASFVVVRHTRFGRYLYAIGDNRTAATFAAIPVRRVEWTLYAASGLIAGLVALAYAARGGAAVPTAGAGRELHVIACVVLGGTRVTGGAGGIGRTLLGLAILANLEIGLSLMSNSSWTLPWSDQSFRLNANGRLVIVGLLVILIAVWNERVAQARE